MSKIVKQHVPCPCGKSSDAYCEYDDRHGYCYSCSKFFNNGREDIDADYEFKTHPVRGISSATMKRYGCLTKFNKGSAEPIEIGFTYPNGAVKVRSFEKKSFYSSGDMKSAHLFGRDKFEEGGPVIYITEGEFDAMSIYEVLQAPAVSIRSASSARVDCTKERNYLNSFKKIVLVFDSDDPGQRAARDVASLFDFHKVFNVKLNQYKDPNDFLQNEKVGELIEAVKSAKKYTPDNIISNFSEIAQSLTESREDQIGTYPFRGLQNALYGLHRGEVIVFKGDEGIGKTEVFRSIQNHLLKESEENKIGIIHLEEDKGTTVKGIATYYKEYPFIHPDNSDDVSGIMSAYKEAVGNNEERVYIYESFDVEDETVFIDNIRFLVSVCGCQFIFLDHITWLATGTDDENERMKLDRISQNLKLLAKQLNFCLVMISHTNDEGKTRGSRNITKVANTVVHLSRDKVSPIESIRNQTKFVVEKGRIAGSKTGPAGHGMYDPECLMLRDGEY